MAEAPLVNLVWGEKAQSWLGIWGLADWIYCISGQEEDLQGYESCLSFSLLMWHSGQERLDLWSRKLFQQFQDANYVPFVWESRDIRPKSKGIRRKKKKKEFLPVLLVGVSQATYWKRQKLFCHPLLETHL